MADNEMRGGGREGKGRGKTHESKDENYWKFSNFPSVL